MKGNIEVFIGTILFAVMALCATSYITATINTTNARDYHASVINEIEASNFNADVMSGLYTDALDKGYELDPITVTEIQNHKKVAEVILHYKYTIGFLNISEDGYTIRGYAR